MSLRVLINDRPLAAGGALTGVGNYVLQLLTHLPAVAPDVRADPFLARRMRWLGRGPLAPPRPAKPAKPPAIHAPSSPKRSSDFVRRILQGGHALALRAQARLGGYDVYHEPNHIPVPCHLPTVTTVHDLSVVVHPEWHPADRVAWYERSFAAGVRQTRVFIAASEFTRGEMLARLNLPAERVIVAYQAARDQFTPQSDEIVRETLATYRLPPRFFLYVGTLEPRKNVPGLLAAYAGLPPSLRRDVALVVVGPWGWKAEQLRGMLADQHLSQNVILPGYMNDPQLAALYSACTAFVWPTFYEGFGLPPIEAMACGAPVITSDVASLPEVVGDAGVRLDPHDTPAWTAAMQRAAEDAAWRTNQRAASRAQAARFTWRHFVEQHLAAFEAARKGRM